MAASAESLELPAHKKVGRPSTFNTRTLRNTKEYLKNNVDTVPTVAGLSDYLGVPRNNIYQWIEQKVSEEFNSTVALMASRRERILINEGLKGKLNSNIAKLILTTNHGYSENNQSHSGVTVNVSRDGVTVQSGSNRVNVDSESSGETAKSVPGHVIEHESSGK